MHFRLTTIGRYKNHKSRVIYIYIYVRACVYMCVYVRIYIYIYIYIYIFIWRINIYALNENIYVNSSVIVRARSINKKIPYIRRSRRNRPSVTSFRSNTIARPDLSHYHRSRYSGNPIPLFFLKSASNSSISDPVPIDWDWLFRLYSSPSNKGE